MCQKSVFFSFFKFWYGRNVICFSATLYMVSIPLVFIAFFTWYGLKSDIHDIYIHSFIREIKRFSFLSCSKKCKLKKTMFKRTTRKKEMKFWVWCDDCIQTFCFKVMRYAIKTVRNANNSLIRTVKSAIERNQTKPTKLWNENNTTVVKLKPES